MSEKFDADYYQRFYFKPDTRIAEPDYFDRVAHFLTAYVDMLGCEITTILDAGCGAGLFHPGLQRAWPQATIDAFDCSRYACDRYGWRQASLQSFETDSRYDLVICHDVIQYLDDREAAKVISKLADWSTQVLFFGALTREDWDSNCDQERTDKDAHLRTRSWYARRLGRRFRNAGGGLFVHREADLVLYALESL